MFAHVVLDLVFQYQYDVML